jgi:predicted alpha-1,2-mannosidase
MKPMNSKQPHFAKLIVLLIVLFTAADVAAQKKLTQYVNPYIGTGGHGHTFPGVTTPFGMVQLSPDTRIDGSWDGCSGYHYSDSIIYGFSHTHLSGTGVSDYGDIMLMPTLGSAKYFPALYAEDFRHKNEKAEAGYYSVLLNNNVKVELTSTTRVGMHQYTFPKTDSANLVFDLMHRDLCTETLLVVQSNSRIVGYRKSKAWATDQYIAFVMEFSKPFEDFTVANEAGATITERSISDPNAKLNFRFISDGKPILVKVALSPVGPDGAQKNLEAELPHWSFKTVRQNAQISWNLELNKILVESENKNDLIKFYSALYHVMIHPNVASDVDGRYRGMDKKIYKAEGYTHYSIFSLWDTFRALHPLLSIIDRERTRSFVHTFLNMYEQGGRLPVWELASNETDCMIGYHSVSVIADAASKGITDFDQKLALDAMVKSATWSHLGLPAYMTNGVISIDDEHESVSKTLEYAYDDWCIAQFAQQSGNDEVYKKFLQRSLNYKNTLDPSTGLMRPRKNGGWLSPFEPREVNNHFTEANSWQYSFFVPHDISGHIAMLGGVERFEAQLDKLFTESSQTTGRDQADITGLIGQYAHGNEPSHHMAYLYNYIGKPEKTQVRIRQILTELYHNAPDGLSGNEDCGQMSAWFVLSSLGIYQVTPGQPDFTFGYPLFDNSTIKFEDGVSLVINRQRTSEQDQFIQQINLNNQPYTKSYISYKQLLAGGSLSFKMSSTAAAAFGKDKQDIPATEVKIKDWVSLPVIEAPGKSFKESIVVKISAASDCKIYYTTDGSQPSTQSKQYHTNIELTQTTLLRAIAVNESNIVSGTVKADFYKMSPKRKVEIKSTYSAQYSAGGNEGIIDGIRGDVNWRKGEWQGYPKQNFEAIVDLGKSQKINEVGAGFLQDTRAWIIMPTLVEFFVSADGKTFKKIAEVKNTIAADDYKEQTKDFTAAVSKAKGRYVKVIAHNFGKLPSWHQGYPFSGEAYIFTDEIWVK